MHEGDNVLNLNDDARGGCTNIDANGVRWIAQAWMKMPRCDAQNEGLKRRVAFLDVISLLDELMLEDEPTPQVRFVEAFEAREEDQIHPKDGTDDEPTSRTGVVLC